MKYQKIPHASSLKLIFAGIVSRFIQYIPKPNENQTKYYGFDAQSSASLRIRASTSPPLRKKATLVRVAVPKRDIRFFTDGIFMQKYIYGIVLNGRDILSSFDRAPLMTGGLIKLRFLDRFAAELLCHAVPFI